MYLASQLLTGMFLKIHLFVDNYILLGGNYGDFQL